MKLIATLGPLKGLTLNLEEKTEWIIGRDPDQCNFVLEDNTVSRKHCKIYNTEEGYVIKNLSTTNPTEVNDERIDESFLNENDKVKIGNTYFLYTSLSKEEIEEAPLFEEPKEEAEEEILEEEPYVETPVEELPEKIETKEEKIEKPIEEEEKTLEKSKKPEEKEEISEEKPLEEEPSEETIFEENVEEIPSPLILETAFILKVITGPNAGAEFGMDKSKTYIIGKDPVTSDIIFTDLSVSKNNTQVTIDENKNIFVEDLGSKNGTYINGIKIEGKTQITSSDLITLGTTTFIIVEREALQETIYTPALTFEKEEKKEISEEEEKVEEEAKAVSWKKQIIPIRHLVLAGSFVIVFFVVFLSFFALFKANKVDTSKKQPVNEIKKVLEKYSDVQFSYNPSSSNLLLVGHVLTNIEKQELIYDLNELNFVSNIEDTTIVDEGVWKDFNSIISSQEDFKSVSLHANKPGHFIVEGYVKTPDVYQKLSDYINANFPYVNKLENKVVIDQILQAEIATKLFKNNFPSVNFEIVSGELILAGRYNEAKSKTYQNLLEEFKKTNGISSIKNLAIPSSEAMARVDLSDKYKITGSAMYDGTSFSVVANGKIVTIGDKLDGMLITLISSNAIFLEKDDIKYKISYSP